MPLGLWVDVLKENRNPSEMPGIEIHTSVTREFNGAGAPNATEEAKKSEAKRIVDKCQDIIRIQKHFSGDVKVFIWEQKPKNAPNFDWLHNRYILTDVGGVFFGHGTDAPGQGTDDLILLPKEEYLLRWRQYSDGTQTFTRIMPD